ncbi:DUF2304 domain-containing protein [Candidatus Woesearchaeota archaeon]|nr:DUF2304 domain-containing protein [Candidatus Woesearchaeota archaeon]
MALGIQIAGFLFGLFMLYYSFLNYKRKEFSTKELTFWFLVWGVFILISLFPNILDPIVKVGGFLRALDLLIISGFLFLIASIFYTYTIARKNQKQLETIVRAIATSKSKKK